MNILCFSYFAGIFGLLQRFISRDKIRYHGASENQNRRFIRRVKICLLYDGFFSFAVVRQINI